jgi:hypothetical protein
MAKACLDGSFMAVMTSNERSHARRHLPRNDHLCPGRRSAHAARGGLVVAGPTGLGPTVRGYSRVHLLVIDEAARVPGPAPQGGRRVGGIDFGFRNPFAAVWGTLDRDGILF